MSKKTKKEKFAERQTVIKQTGTSPKKNETVKSTKQFRNACIAIIGILAFLIYSNTLNHGYVLDDFSLIKENFQTKQGTKALKEIFSSSYRTGYYLPDNDLYRPLSKAMFAIEWQLAPDKPALSHWVNVLLYAISGMLLFIVLSKYMKNNYWLPFITTILFIAHPIHTEVVANIKSRDEILGLLFFLVTAYYTFLYTQKNKVIYLIASGIAFFLSLLSKESTITFIAVIPLLNYFFIGADKKMHLLTIAPLAIAILLFMYIRYKILGSGPEIHPSLMDNLLVSTHNKTEQFATAVYILFIYVLLFIAPFKLVSDRSFNDIPIIGITSIEFIIAIVFFLSIAIYSIKTWKEKNVISFGILFFFITASLASNIFFIIGTSYAERLMYVPLLGFCIVAGALLLKVFSVDIEKPLISIQNLFEENKKLSLLLLTLVLVYSVKTYSRNKAWESNYSLHKTDVALAPGSARAHYYYGNIITQEEYLASIKDNQVREAILDTAMREMRTTINIYKGFADAYHKIGKIHLIHKKLDSARVYYEKALSLNPGNSMYLNNYGTVLFNLGNLEGAKKQFELSLQTNPNQSDAYSNLGSVYGSIGQMALSQNNKEESKKNFEMAIVMFQRCVALAPNYASGYYMLGITYKSLGDEVNAQQYINKAKSLGLNIP